MSGSDTKHADARRRRMAMHLMLDLETWSTKNHALVISVGACFFDPQDEIIGAKFYAAIDPEQAPPGAHIDPGTILWWMSPERTEARLAWLQEAKVSAHDAMSGLAEWVNSIAAETPVNLWGNGATFDNVILHMHYQMLGLDPFWRDGFGDRCYRTLKSLAPGLKIERSGVYHNALDDAVDQARHMQRIVRSLGITV